VAQIDDDTRRVPMHRRPMVSARSWDPPVIVVEGPVGCSREDVEVQRARGLLVIDGFRVPARPAGAVCVGVVDGAESAAKALLAVLGGAGIVVEARGDRATIDRLVDDLRRRGPVDHRVLAGPAALAGPDISVEARAIMSLLAMGVSLGEAAHMLGLSRRTADRRLAEARRSLGVDRTTEAIAMARRLGWLDRSRERPAVS
jgi:DNA-binding CsgD family transcriptional regulator